MRDRVVIRSATALDLGWITRVELEAGELFRDVGLPEVAGDEPRAEDLLDAVAEQRVWVAEVVGEGGSAVAGYVLAEVLDGAAHIAQVSDARSPRCAMVKANEE